MAEKSNHMPFCGIGMNLFYERREILRKKTFLILTQKFRKLWPVKMCIFNCLL
uniref:Uncharacterized protein n=1 Tax=Anguilla anguilla TaxID=7936 RepID=A0A0E9RHK3_ANGAN